MPESKFSVRNKSVAARRIVAVFCCVLLVLAAVGMGYGQAGRRVAKPKSDPPVPKSAEPVAPVKEATPEAERIPMFVVASRPSMMGYAAGLTDNLPGVVARRLSDSRRLQVASGGEMSRGEANKRAKSGETKAFVVWLELQGDGIDLDPLTRRTRIEHLSVRYVILEPGTGKMKDQGSVHLRPVRGGVFGGVLRLPSCYPQVSSDFEYAIMQAGIETAERIIRSFSLPNPTFCS
ncbi:MAG TPA: hypothetical protein VIQ24_04480 [Pyrinomonadaceae bacterium]